MSDAPIPETHRYRTLIISHDVLGEKMAGPGIRTYHLSRILCKYVDLKLAVRPQSDTAVANLQSLLPDVAILPYERHQWETLREAAEWAEIIIVSPYAAYDFTQIAALPAYIVMDGYDPLLIEWLLTLPTDEAGRYVHDWRRRMTVLFFQYLIGDFFICASERQRHWWLGQLEVAGRINPYTYLDDPSLRRLIDVVAYGLPEEPATHTKQVVKGVWPGISEDDIVLLWGGGLWSWLDPETAVHAIARLHPQHPRLKLIFPGTIHPNPEIGGAMPVHNTDIYTFAEEQNLLNKAIFFGEWVPYADWPNVLLESDIALSLHDDTLETQFAFRSRMLEYIWAGLPMIATEGDATSELVADYNLGELVGYQDVDGVCEAILQMINHPTAYQTNLASARSDLTWEQAAQPLIRFCRNPRRAADRIGLAETGVPYYQTTIARMRHEYQSRINQLEEQVGHLDGLVKGYESGKFVRLMKRVHALRQRWLPK